MIFSYLDETNVFRRYEAAKSYTDRLTVPFTEFQRIARNRPYEGIDPNYPKTTDGTTASIVRKTPRRVIQQLPTGRVENDAADWLSVVAEFIYTKKILPYANEEYDLIQKCWTNVENGLTVGFGASYAPFVNHDGYLCTDMSLIYWGDLSIQPGKKSGYACNYLFMRSWWQSEDIESLIDRENKLAASAKQRGEQYESTWDAEALAKIKEIVDSKDQQAKTPMEDERGGAADGVELVTGFQKGVGAKFFTFHPATKTIVRTEVNKDPRGKMPIDFLYGDIDGSNPLGRGIVELVGGLQNLIDSDMQMYQYNRALLLAPPIVKYGNFNKNKIQLVPNAVIDAGSDPNAKIVPLTIDTTAIANYPQLYGLQKSQLLNLVSSPDTSISADVGNPGFSKTPAGVNQQRANISVDDNYVRKMFEAWFESWSETAINLYFAKRSGIDELQLDQETADRLRKLATQGKFDLSMLSPDNKIRVNYDTATPALKFRVDASTSKMKDDSEQLQALTGILQTLDKTSILQSIVPPEKIAGAWNAIVSASGVENPEELTMNEDDIKKMLAMQQGAGVRPPSESISFKDVAAQSPADAAAMLQQAGLPGQVGAPQPQQPTQPQPPVQQAPQPQMSAEDQQIAAQLQQLGLSDAAIQQVISQVNQGVPARHLIQGIQGAVNGR